MRKFVTSFLLFAFFLVGARPVLARVVPNDPYYQNQWYLARIKADSAWEKISTSPDIVIAVIDSGIDIEHPDLKNNIWHNPREQAGNGIDDDNNGFIDDYQGWDFTTNQPDPRPQISAAATETGLSHGTMIAGIIAAQGNNGLGVAGVTWRAKIMPLKAISDQGEGRISDVVRAIDYATNNGANIINLSFVSYNYSQAVYEVIKRAYQAGVIVVAAAGNEQSHGQAYNLDETPVYPACYDGIYGENMVIGVGATDALDQKTTFSGYGQKCIDLVAPGISFFNTVSPLAGDHYYDGYWSGTSMAAPLVSATLALMAQINPELSSRELVELLLESTDNIDLLNPSYLGLLGAGRLNTSQAVHLAQTKLYDRLGRLILWPQTKGQSAKLSSVSGELLEELVWTKDLPAGGSLAIGDLDGDGIEELVLGAAPGELPQVKIYSLAGELKREFLVREESFRGGINVALANLDSRGGARLIVTAKQGDSVVRSYDLEGRLVKQFYAGAKEHQGGLSLAVGDLEGNGDDKIVVAYGAKEEPQLKIFDQTGKIISAFLAYEASFRGGVNLAVANLDGRRDGGKAEIIVAPGPGRRSEVKVFNNYGEKLESFQAYGNNWRGGVQVSAGDINNDGLSEIILGANPGATAHVRVFTKTGLLLESFYAWPEDFSGGVYPGVIKISN